MKIRRYLLIIVIVLGSSYTAFGEEAERSARIMGISGEAGVRYLDQKRWVSAERDMILNQGDAVRTGEGGWMLIKIEDEDPALKERAVELYAMATSHPFIAKAQLFEDVAGRYVRAATADLEPEVVQAAKARGGELDWWETAETLLEELRELGWANRKEVPGTSE